MQIFEHDEFETKKVEKGWSVDTLLAQEGMFYLKDVAKKLGLKAYRLQAEARSLGKDSWKTMGVRKVWTHWILRMKVFRDYYEANLKPPYRQVDPGWDANRLLEESDIFLLTDVCNLVPFSPFQLRYQARRNPDPRANLGIWKDEESQRWLIDMSTFSPWIKKVWKDWNGHLAA